MFRKRWKGKESGKVGRSGSEWRSGSGRPSSDMDGPLVVVVVVVVGPRPVVVLDARSPHVQAASSKHHRTNVLSSVDCDRDGMGWYVVIMVPP